MESVGKSFFFWDLLYKIRSEFSPSITEKVFSPVFELLGFNEHNIQVAFAQAICHFSNETSYASAKLYLIAKILELIAAKNNKKKQIFSSIVRVDPLDVEKTEIYAKKFYYVDLSLEKWRTTLQLLNYFKKQDNENFGLIVRFSRLMAHAFDDNFPDTIPLRLEFTGPPFETHKDNFTPSLETKNVKSLVFINQRDITFIKLLLNSNIRKNLLELEFVSCNFDQDLTGDIFSNEFPSLLNLTIKDNNQREASVFPKRSNTGMDMPQRFPMLKKLSIESYLKSSDIKFLKHWFQSLDEQTRFYELELCTTSHSGKITHLIRQSFFNNKVVDNCPVFIKIGFGKEKDIERFMTDFKDIKVIGRPVFINIASFKSEFVLNFPGQPNIHETLDDQGLQLEDHHSTFLTHMSLMEQYLTLGKYPDDLVKIENAKLVVFDTDGCKFTRNLFPIQEIPIIKGKGFLELGVTRNFKHVIYQELNVSYKNAFQVMSRHRAHVWIAKREQEIFRSEISRANFFREDQDIMPKPGHLVHRTPPTPEFVTKQYKRNSRPWHLQVYGGVDKITNFTHHVVNGADLIIIVSDASQPNKKELRRVETKVASIRGVASEVLLVLLGSNDHIDHLVPSFQAETVSLLSKYGLKAFKDKAEMLHFSDNPKAIEVTKFQELLSKHFESDNLTEKRKKTYISCRDTIFLNDLRSHILVNSLSFTNEASDVCLPNIDKKFQYWHELDMLYVIPMLPGRAAPFYVITDILGFWDLVHEVTVLKKPIDKIGLKNSWELKSLLENYNMAAFIPKDVSFECISGPNFQVTELKILKVPEQMYHLLTVMFEAFEAQRLYQQIVILLLNNLKTTVHGLANYEVTQEKSIIIMGTSTSGILLTLEVSKVGNHGVVINSSEHEGQKLHFLFIKIFSFLKNSYNPKSTFRVRILKEVEAYLLTNQVDRVKQIF